MQQSVLQIWLGLPPALKKIISGIVVFIIFWIIAHLASIMIKRLNKHRNLHIMIIIRRLAKNILLVIGIVCALGTAGVNVSALIASLGLLGFAAGYALKDLLSNIIAGFMLMLNRTIKKGDKISVSSSEGVVDSITLRYTILKTDTQTLYIPNSTLFTNTLTVFNK
jgi:small-conductance mechanosensitive channel